MKFYIDDSQTLKEICEKVNRMRPPAKVKRVLDSILEQIKDADAAAAEEVENLERIVHGEIPKPPFEVKEGRLTRINLVSEEEGIGRITLVDADSSNDWIVDALADTSRKNPWREYNNELRAIEGFSKYVINRRGQVFLKATEETVGQMKGSKYTTVLLTNDDGITKRMVVEILVKNAFPEIKIP